MYTNRNRTEKFKFFGDRKRVQQIIASGGQPAKISQKTKILRPLATTHNWVGNNRQAAGHCTHAQKWGGGDGGREGGRGAEQWATIITFVREAELLTICWQVRCWRLLSDRSLSLSLSGPGQDISTTAEPAQKLVSSQNRRGRWGGGGRGRAEKPKGCPHPSPLNHTHPQPPHTHRAASPRGIYTAQRF